MLLISRRVLFLVLLSACVSYINASPVDSSHNIGVQLLNENREEYSQNVQQYQYTVDNGPTQTNFNVQNPTENIIRCSYFYIAPDGRAYVLTYIGNEYQYQIFIRDYQTGLLVYPGETIDGIAGGGLGGAGGAGGFAGGIPSHLLSLVG